MQILAILASAVISAASFASPSGLVAGPDGKMTVAVRWSGLDAMNNIDIFSSADMQSWGSSEASFTGVDAGGTLFCAPDKTLHLFYSSAGMALHAVRAASGWGSAEEIGPGLVNGVPAVRADGAWVIAADGPDGAFTYVSSDGGKSWKASEGKVLVPQKILDTMTRNPKLFLAPDGGLRMAVHGFRTGFCYYAASPDGGLTWDVPRKMIHNPDKDYAVLNSPDGNMVYVKNCRFGEVEFTRDDEMFAFVSTTGGDVWRKGVKVSGQKFSTDPAVCFDADGNLYVAYSRRYNETCEVNMVKVSGPVAGAPVTVVEAGNASEGYRRFVGGLLDPKTDWASHTVKMVSYNTLRSQWSGGRNAWLPRFKTICEHLKALDGDVIGMQETSKEDIADFRKVLKDYDYIAITPEIMGPSVSEARATSELPIWWRKSRLTLEKKGWLEFNIVNDIRCGVNATIESWGNGQDGNKAAIWGIFLDKKTGKRFCVFNLHLPTRSEPAKLATAKMVAAEAAKVAGGLPVFITGDFNMNEEGFTFKYLENDVAFLADGGLATPPEKRKDWEVYSGSGLNPLEKRQKNGKHIDHVFFTPASAEPVGFETCNWLGSNGSVGSDHLPVAVEFKYAN